MPTLKIEVEFLTDRCVAAQVDRRDAAEWPPHPGRLFMALAATCFERGEAPEEAAALDWLATLDPPVIEASDASHRSEAKHYVPINDKLAPSKSLLQTTPGLARSKQERSFPTAIPHDPLVTYAYDVGDDVATQLKPLAALCHDVIRVGHSSSLVRASARLEQQSDADDPQATQSNPSRDRWVPAASAGELNVRVAGEGEMSRLRVSGKRERIEAFVALAGRIDSAKGKAKTEAKKEFQESFGQAYKASLRPPEATPPVLGLWQTYTRQTDDERQPAIEGEHFDPQLLILTKFDGRSLGLQDTLAVTRRLRDAALSRSDPQPAPSWLSGHDDGGQPTRDPHAAFLPLPFASHPHADGHLMGMAIAMPRRISPADRGQCLRRLFFNDRGEEEHVELALGRLGMWTLRLEDRDEPPRSLRNATWIGPSRTWASVTPVVLDRFPKADRKDRKRWNAEVAETVAAACPQSGLPMPTAVDLDTTSWHQGVPRSHAKRRRLRGGEAGDSTTTLGDGFPSPPRSGNKPPRPQVHVHLTFDRPVSGPVLIGSGRFYGYGFCKPIASRMP